MYQMKIEHIVERTIISYWLVTLRFMLNGKLVTILAEGDSPDQASEFAIDTCRARQRSCTINNLRKGD